MTISPIRLFAYGTLRAGGKNHHYVADHELLWRGWTEPIYEFVSFGAFPALLEGGSTSVVGDVYLIDAGTLARIDRQERHPDWYRRHTIRMRGKEVFVYLMPSEFAEGRPRIESGDWCEHLS